MPYNFFAPKPGRLGTLPVPFQSGRLNTGTLTTSPQNHNIGGFPAKSYINRATFCADTYPVTATNCTATLTKMTGATAVPLTSALDINNKTADTPLQFAFLTTLTEAQRTLLPGDSLRVVIAFAGAVSTQPDDCTVNVELLVEE